MINKLSWFNRQKNSIQTGHPTNTDSFFHFLFKNAGNKRYLLIALAGILLQFVVFKLCYPFADFFTDSYTYINAAEHHHVMSFRPVGYSRFLEAIHWLTTSDTALIFIQYLVIQAGGLILFFSIRYFFPLHKTISNVFFAILVFNPLTLYISNYVASDALFAGFSLLWFTQLIWIINRTRWIQLLPLAGLLFLLFTLRFAALCLPAIAILALLLSRRNWLFQITGIALTVLPIFIEIQRIKHITKKETGTAVFSAFSSWTLVNNALHMYPYIEVKDADMPTTELLALNRIVKQYFDTLPESARPYPTVTVDYLWGSNSPLKTYMHSIQKQKNIPDYFSGWHAVAPVLSQYGNRLVRQHPVAFARYFLWPNAKCYGLPQLESLKSYNENHNTVDSTAIRWFRYKSEQVTCINKTAQGFILQPVPYLFLLANIILCITLAIVIVRAKHYALSQSLLRTLLLGGSYWIINFCFSIYATPIILRYQYFPMIVIITFASININQLQKGAKAKHIR